MATVAKKTVVLMVVVLLTCLSIPTEQATTPISSSATTAASAKISSTESSTAVQQTSGPTDASTDQQSTVTTVSPSNSTPNITHSNSTPKVKPSNSTSKVTPSNSTSNDSTLQPNNVKTANASSKAKIKVTTRPNTALTTPSPTPKRGHLLCYQCASSTAGELCETDAGGMLNVSRDWVWHKNMSLTYFKDCTASNPVWDRCMIETIYKNDKLILYHRGCHDGVTFAQNAKNDSLSPRFHSLAPNNQTTCDEVGDQLYCYRFCNIDFCNGPEPPKPKDICDEYKRDPYIDLNGTVCAGSSLVASDLPITAKLLGQVMASVILIGWMTVT